MWWSIGTENCPDGWLANFRQDLISTQMWFASWRYQAFQFSGWKGQNKA